MSKKDKDHFIDDGRVIAKMDIDGMPPSLFGRRRIKELEPDESKKTYSKLSGKEKRNIWFGVISSYLVFGFFFFGLLALIILLVLRISIK